MNISRRISSPAACAAAALFAMLSFSVPHAHAQTKIQDQIKTQAPAAPAAAAEKAPAFAPDQFERGYGAYNKGDWGMAIAMLRPLVENGDARAMVILANMYSEGHGVVQDYREAYTLYRRAAFRDNADAMVALGAMYQSGLGTGKNVPLAIQWFHRAGRLGNQSGAMMYALHCYRGFKTDDGTFDMKPDKLEAFKWLRIAATHGENRKIRHAAYALGMKLSQEIKPYEADEINRKVDSWAPDTPDVIGPNPEQAEVDAQKQKILSEDPNTEKQAPAAQAQDKTADKTAVKTQAPVKTAPAPDKKK